MNTIQVAASQPGIYVKNISHLHHFLSKPCVLSMDAKPLSWTSLSLRSEPSSGLQNMPSLKSRQPLHVCLAGGQGMMENNEDSQWKSLEKAMEQFKGKSIEDMLRQQIQKGEYYDNGGSGAKPPGGQGGGGGGSGDGGFAGMSDETLQVILATIGFIFLYIYVINGVELAKLARDFIKYKLGGNQSVRLKRAMYKWTRFYKNMTEKKEVDKNELENAPNNTNYYRDVLRNYMKSNSNE
ncbi:uncharacterized protein LOC133311915 [Gastrolobium bilobum]|uniref:uncharacterized protein LOC133311915 n=1 Tax=Gastrolobium bilobum TaxID=150636 RepID=UPI002AAF4797|nr:uncharacterized protein LOC133311915 [Gastrolobium bilobum]XP_061369039.1 uncharacterized protein LOC133311915 [Gastrolobium bilobum]